MTAIKLYRLLGHFLSAVNEVAQGLYNETMTVEEASARITALVDQLKVDLAG